MEVYREILPNSYLLILLSVRKQPILDDLKEALHQAGRSGKQSVWIDCSCLLHMSQQAANLLLHHYRLLRRRNVQLVLCHLSPHAEQAFHKLAPTGGPPVVSNLLDADRYCRQRVKALKASQKPSQTVNT